MPERYGTRKSVSNLCRALQPAGIWTTILTRLQVVGAEAGLSE